MSREHVATYLNDHLAGSNFALELLDQLIAEAAGMAPTFAALKNDIDADRQQLRTLMNALEITESRVRKAGSWIAQLITEVKLGVDDEEKGPLRRLERLEALAIGIEGKIALWLALQATSSSNPKLTLLDYTLLRQRAQQQRALVETLRLDAARAALTA